jgi:hypothetical protein
MKLRTTITLAFIVGLACLACLQGAPDLPRGAGDQTTGLSVQSPTPNGDARQPVGTKPFPGSVILGRPSDTSIAFSFLSPSDLDVFIEYGKLGSSPANHTGQYAIRKNFPSEIELAGLERNSSYGYRVCWRNNDQTEYFAGTESRFATQRSAGTTFNFAVQGDSHPERLNRMFNPELYLQTLNAVKAVGPDFYFTLGDDFSLDPLIDKGQLSQQAVADVYANQRNFLGLLGSPVYLVNGNHEDAAKYLLDGTPNNAAVLAGNTRISYFPLPAPDTFYSGDSEPIKFVGLPRDYYSWTWGDAQFIVIDFYWHSSVAVDSAAGGGGGKNRSLWDVTLGATQYRWFQQTLADSKARYKFVFAHHVLGTGRGGIEEAVLAEWGGREFDKMRPGWDLPIHQLMAKYGVTIFFQGHDHLFAKQDLDGVIYQETPNPADPTYDTFNRDAYRSGQILPNSGFLNVSVSTSQVKVDYIRSFLPADGKTGSVVFSYAVLPH